MSYFEQFMQANQAYVALHGQLNLPLKPKTRVAIVTCMDSRLHVAQALGLALGDAHILRNAGGRVTEDMISSGIYVSLVFYTTFSIYHCSAFSFIFQSKIKQE